MKRVGVLQSNYIPWKGYFDIIHDVDLFVFYDDVQYTKNDWRNRNKIKGHNGALWLTIPVNYRRGCLINEIEIKDKDWAIKHCKSLKQYYSKTPYYKKYQDFFQYVYLGRQWDTLSELNQYLIQIISKEFLAIDTEFCSSSQWGNKAVSKTDRLMSLLKAVNAQQYVSGPSGKNYLNNNEFSINGIELVYKTYVGYPEYSQLYPPFIHELSVIDLLFHVGSEAPYYIWGWREDETAGEACQ